MRNRDGFTLLELVAALSLSAVIGIWAAGFFGSQMHEYKKQTQILKTEELADRVCFQITSRLDHAFLFRIHRFSADSLNPKKVLFCITARDPVN